MDDAITPASEIEELQRAIAALDSQRGVLGEAVVASALAAMRAQLSILRAQATDQRKLVSILFADLVGFTALSETLDPEDLRDLQQDYFTRWRRAIEQQGGVVEKFIGDAVMAVFGVPAAQEDDAERAVRSALALHAALDELNAARGTALQMRAGVQTGLVLISGSGADFVATGDAVNVAARLQANAPPGQTLISHATYQHVRGLFQVAAQQPLALKGKAQPQHTYLVAGSLPAGFRTMARGVEGVETRMIGREAELLALQQAFAVVVEEGAARTVLVVAEPGLGKSRLAYEFSLWLADQDPAPQALRARAAPHASATSMALLRDLFGQHFTIRDTDSPAEAIARFRAGAAGCLAADEADLAGHFCGFDFSDSEAVRRLLGQEALAHLGLAYLIRYFEWLGQARPLVLLVEDLHWADDRALDTLLALAARGRLAAPVLVVGMVRPVFFEQRPGWAEGLTSVAKLPLKPLTPPESRALLGEILYQAAQFPPSLLELIVTAAEGNPFFAEELVKMLVDDGVILVQSDGWQVKPERVAGLQVPATLTGVLQARLDSLPASERETLQRAAVVGREFWHEAVERLREPQPGEPWPDPLRPLLDTLRGRELVYRHEHSTFADTTEYVFKHALLRDVTYETVLRRMRRRCHRQAAEWMEGRATERLAEFAGLIAYHFQQAQAVPQALGYLSLAAETALSSYANAEAAAYFQQALDLQPASHSRARLLDGLGRALVRQAEYAAAIAAWREAIALYQPEGDTDRAARLYARIARAIYEALDTPSSLAEARAGLAAMAGAPMSPGLAALHHEVGRTAFFNGGLDEAFTQTRAALDMAEEIRAVDVEADALATWGLLPQVAYPAQVAALRRAVALAEDAGLMLIAQRAHNNLGTALVGHADNLTEAVAAYRRASQIARQRGAVINEAIFLDNVVASSGMAGDLAVAREAAERVRELAEAQPGSLWIKHQFLTSEATCLRHEGSLERAIPNWQASVAFFDTTGDPQSISWQCWNLGWVFTELRAFAEAEAVLTRAIWADTRPRGIGAVFYARTCLSECYSLQGRVAEASELLSEAEAMAAGHLETGAIYLLLRCRAALAAGRAEWDTAFSHWQTIHQHYRQTNAHWLANYVVLDMADTYLRRNAPGDTALARAQLTEALANFKAMGANGYVTRLQARLNALDAATGDSLAK